jgi:hypothetical protein
MEKKDGRWWGTLGKPQYGDELFIRSIRNIVNFDPYNGTHLTQIYIGWRERLFSEDWAVDSASFEYKTMAPNHYLKGLLTLSFILIKVIFQYNT